MKRKKFENGDDVEVQAEVDAKWEPATYTAPEWRGWHSVYLERDRYVNLVSNTDCDASDPRAYRTRTLCVPTQRLRSRK